jgi:hypothetical protein
MCGDFMSIVHIIPKAAPSQKHHINIGPILNGYGDMGI